MAQGDGWRRHIFAELPDGTRKWVSFNDFNPATMKECEPATAEAVGAAD